MVNAPQFTNGVGLCGVYECGEGAVARVAVEAREYDYIEHDTYLGSDVLVDVCQHHKDQVEADYQAALDREQAREAERAEAQRELDELLAKAEEARDRLRRI